MAHRPHPGHSGHPPPRCAEDLLRLGPALDEGRGTAYERYALDLFLQGIARRLDLRRALELPANGVMGVPGIKSLALAASGVEVTLAVPNDQIAAEVRTLWEAVGLNARVITVPLASPEQAPDGFDLVWSFCVLEHLPRMAAYLRAMATRSARYLLVLTQNPFNPGYPVHRLYHRLHAEPWDHGDLWPVRPAQVVREVRAAGVEVIEVGGVDLPPWPDINIQLRPPRDGTPEDYADDYATIRPGLRRRSTDEIARRIRAAGPARGPWPMIYRGWQRVEQRLPRWFLTYGSHHPYVLGRVT